jgi:plastocyanin
MKNALASVSLIALLLAGCGGRSAAPLSAMPPVGTDQSVTTIAFDDSGIVDLSSTTIGIRLNGESPFTDSRYGRVIGYFKGTTSLTSQVITLHAGKSVKFKNVDASFVHTFSFLGNATANKAPWPHGFTGSMKKSKAGTAIGTTNFSTGPLTPGHFSAVYTTGVPGFYMVGCAFHYVLDGMRTVIIVQ